jgi:hypothetical protein
MELGQAMYTAGKYGEAAEAFLNAYKTQPFAAFLFNAGVAFEKGGEYAEAADHFERYLEEEKDAPDREDIEARIDALRQKAASEPGQKPTFVVEKRGGGPHPPPCAGGGAAPHASVSMKSIVQVRTDPAGAKVVITDLEGNEILKSVSPTEQTLEPGKYQLGVEHPEFKKALTPLNVSEGRVYVVHVELSQGTFLGYLSVKSSVPGAEVFLDDREAGAVGNTPWGNPVPTGDHVVWVEWPGYQGVEKSVSIGVGETLEMDVQLEKVDHGEIEVVTNVDDAVLSIDGKLQPGSLPLTLRLPPGIHEVLVEATGLKEYLADVELHKGMRTKVLVRLNPSPKRTPAYISFGIATALVTAGIVFAVKSKQLNDDMLGDRKNGTLDNNDPRQDQLLGWNIGADTSFLLGGVMAIVGVVYMIRDPLPESEGLVKDPVDFADLEDEK